MVNVNKTLRGVGAFLSVVVLLFIGWVSATLYQQVTPMMFVFFGIGLLGTAIAGYVIFSTLDRRWDG